MSTEQRFQCKRMALAVIITFATSGCFEEMTEEAQQELPQIIEPLPEKVALGDNFQTCRELVLTVSDREKRFEDYRTAYFNVDRYREIDLTQAMPSMGSGDVQSEAPERFDQRKGVREFGGTAKIANSVYYLQVNLDGAHVQRINTDTMNVTGHIQLPSGSNYSLAAYGNHLVVMGQAENYCFDVCVNSFLPNSASHANMSTLRIFKVTADKISLKLQREFTGRLKEVRIVEGDVLLVRGLFLTIANGSPSSDLLSEQNNQIWLDRRPLDKKICAKILTPNIKDFDTEMTALTRIDLSEDERYHENTSYSFGHADFAYITNERVYLVKRRNMWPHWDPRIYTDPNFNRPVVTPIDLKTGNEIAPIWPNGLVRNRWSLFEDKNGDLHSILGERPQYAETSRGLGTFFESFRVGSFRTINLGRLGPLAPGESLKAAYFTESRVHLVTFLEVDPLYTIDFSNIFQPIATSEIKIPGYSSQLYPLSEKKWLGIGRSGDLGAFQLNLIDMTDPLAPNIAEQYVDLESTWTHSEAEHSRRHLIWNSHLNSFVFSNRSWVRDSKNRYNQKTQLSSWSVKNLKMTENWYLDLSIGQYSWNYIDVDGRLFVFSDESYKVIDFESGRILKEASLD